MEAIVLAGGLGTRLREKVYEEPKVLAEINGKPFINYVLEYLYRNGTSHVVLAVSYMHEKIMHSIGDTFMGMTIDYSIEKKPLGTGGAIKQAMKKCRESFVFVLNGDTVFNVDLRKMQQYAKAKSAVIALKYTDNADRCGIVQTKGNTVTSFKEKEAGKSGTVNGGIYLIDRHLLLNKNKKFSFEYDFLEKNCDKLIPFISDGYFVDIGIPEDYEKAQKELPLMKTRTTGKIAFLDRDGTINLNTDHLFKKEDFVFTKNAPEGIYRLKENGYYIVVISNQAGVAKGLYGEYDIFELNNFINNQLRKKGIIIDEYIHCPHHPEGTVAQYAIECGCRKPKTGMVEQAVRDFAQMGIDINLDECILIGDKDSDIQAAKDAKIGKYIKTDGVSFPLIDVNK